MKVTIIRWNKEPLVAKSFKEFWDLVDSLGLQPTVIGSNNLPKFSEFAGPMGDLSDIRYEDWKTVEVLTA